MAVLVVERQTPARILELLRDFDRVQCFKAEGTLHGLSYHQMINNLAPVQISANIPRHD